MNIYDLGTYTTEKGKKPFSEWLNSIRDTKARTKILARIKRASFGIFGDYKPIKDTKGIFEMREHYGSGYRIFYIIIEHRIILLLAGSTKKNQDKAIIKAKKYLEDFERRNDD